jgi:hypothetical protein
MREATDTRSGPSDGDAVELGPVDHLVIEFPAGRRTVKACTTSSISWIEG